MTQTTLYYNGAAGVPAFTDPERELHALTSGCGLIDLGWRAKITVNGRDRIRWLNGMVTNTVKDLPLNRGNYSFVLTAQGRIVGDLYVYNRGEYLLLDTDRSQLETLMTALKRFIIMDQVELKDSSDTLAAIALCGPASEKVLSAAEINATGLQALEVRDLVVDSGNVTLVRGPEQKPGWYEIWSDKTAGNTTRLAEKLVKAGAQPVGTEALERWRVLQAIPRYGQDIRERDLPQETEQGQALNFTKGCYIGQEIVERIRSRGQVHRKFTSFEFHGALPPPGKFEENGRLLAEITSVAQIGTKKVGLGYVRRETASAGSQLNLGATTATITELKTSSQDPAG